MKRSILALVTGLVIWAVVATLLNFGLRAGLPGYRVAEPAMTFTLGMKIARLTLGALASLAAGAAAGLIAPSKPGVRWVLGAVILALFIPSHPVWYHLTFLGTLVPLVALGGAMVGCNGADRREEIAANVDRAPTVGQN